MSLRSAGVILLASAALAAPLAVRAETGKLGETKTGHEAPAPAAATGGTASEPVTGPTETVDRTTETGGAATSLLQRLHVDFGWEYHAMLVQNNLLGNGAETQFNYFYSTVRYDITKNDKVSLAYGFYRFSLDDPEENGGFRSDDLTATYNHHFSLPWQVGLDVSGSLGAPLSFESYKMGLITAPRVRVGVARTFFKHLSVDARVFGEYYWQRYSTIEGGSAPNPIGRIGASLGVEEELPWHTPLVFGVNVYTGYTWYYNPIGEPVDPTQNYFGVEPFPTYPKNNPAQQAYGAEVYVRYDLAPKIFGVRASAELAYAQGDPTAGYTSMLVDGVSQLYLFYPEASEVYFSLNFKY